VWLSVAAVVLAWGEPSNVTAVASSECEPRAIAWSYVSFQAEQLGNRVTADISIVDLPAAAEQADFLRSPKGTAFKPSGREVVKLSVRIRIDIIGRRPLWLENHAWLDPPVGTPLYLIRTRAGLDDYYQQFRFTQEGVFRRQREPASAAEATRPNESWSKLGEHFYAFPPDSDNCHPILETSTLIYLLSASAKVLNDRTALCVFHKRQLHRVSLQAAPGEAVGFDFLEKKGGVETRRSGTALPRRIRIESRPIGSYRGQVEDLFGKGALIYLCPDGRLPLMLSSELPLIGRVDLKLREIHFN
jgi:hypothetical protein